jgi:flavin reductase (DIM6/NTAB) family NADH-FMN oxidoreductase RutF
MIFRYIQPDDLTENPFSMIGKDWMLLTAVHDGRFNTMTVAWGGLGILWWKPVVTCYVRPERYTAEFLESGTYYSFSVLGPEYRKELEYCGSNTGRAVDKVSETGLTPVRIPDDIEDLSEPARQGGEVFSLDEPVYAFAEARTIIVCRKIWYEDIVPSHVLDDALRIRYEEQNQHRMYVGEIEACLVRQDLSR